MDSAFDLDSFFRNGWTPLSLYSLTLNSPSFYLHDFFPFVHRSFMYSLLLVVLTHCHGLHSPFSSYLSPVPFNCLFTGVNNQEWYRCCRNFSISALYIYTIFRSPVSHVYDYIVYFRIIYLFTFEFSYLWASIRNIYSLEIALIYKLCRSEKNVIIVTCRQ